MDDGRPLFSVSAAGRYLSQKARFIRDNVQKHFRIGDGVLLLSVM
jgi:hypothetical protein